MRPSGANHPPPGGPQPDKIRIGSDQVPMDPRIEGPQILGLVISSENGIVGRPAEPEHLQGTAPLWVTLADATLEDQHPLAFPDWAVQSL